MSFITLFYICCINHLIFANISHTGIYFIFTNCEVIYFSLNTVSIFLFSILQFCYNGCICRLQQKRRNPNCLELRLLL